MKKVDFSLPSNYLGIRKKLVRRILVIVLGIDQAQMLGFAFGEPGGNPKSGLMQVDSSRDEARQFWLFQQAIAELIDRVSADVVCFERTYFSKQTANAQKLTGVFGAVLAKAYDMRVDVMTVPIGTWKKALCGKAGFSKDTIPYPPIDACELRKWRTGDSNDRADAMGIWHWACHRLRPDEHPLGPLI